MHFKLIAHELERVMSCCLVADECDGLVHSKYTD